MRDILFSVLLLTATVAHAVDFTVTVSSTNAVRVAQAFACNTGTNQEKIDCVVARIKNYLKSRVVDRESEIEAQSASDQKRRQSEENFTFQ